MHCDPPQHDVGPFHPIPAHCDQSDEQRPWVDNGLQASRIICWIQTDELLVVQLGIMQQLEWGSLIILKIVLYTVLYWLPVCKWDIYTGKYIVLSGNNQRHGAWKFEFVSCYGPPSGHNQAMLSLVSCQIVM